MELLILILLLAVVLGPLLGIAALSANGNLKARVADLEQRLYDIERRGIAPAVPAEAVPAAPRGPEPAPEPEPAPIYAGFEAHAGGGEIASDAAAYEDAVDDHDDAVYEDAGRHESLGGLFERLVAGKLLIWLGGIALVLAAIFLIRYSIEVGLITPAARMVGAGLFGLALLGAGEYARAGRFADDPRIAQALVGAGIAVLYATVYGSHVLYALIDSRTAFAGMAGVTVAALGLSLRHGVPTAVMGLVGGFLTPLLVGDPQASAVPLLVYLALLDAALFALAWRRGWTWLAAAATLLSFAWTFYLIAQPKENDALLSGGFVVALALVACLVRPGRGRLLVLIQPLAIGIVELAVLVARTDLGAPAWGLFGALSLASLILAHLRRELRPAPVVALLFALLLLWAKATAGPLDLVPTAAIGITALFGAGGLLLCWRMPGPLWTGLASLALAGPFLLIRSIRPEYLDRPSWGALAAALTLGPAFFIWMQRKRANAEAPADLALLIAGGTAGVLAGASVWDLVAPDWVAAGWLGVGLALTLAARRLGDLALGTVAVAAAVLGVTRALWTTPEISSAWVNGILGQPILAADLPNAMRTLSALAVPAILLAAMRFALPPLRMGARQGLPLVAGTFAIAALYVWFKQGFGLADPADFVARGLIERTIITQALFVAGWLLGAGHVRLPRIEADVTRLAGTMLTAFAAARLVWFDIVLFNPVWIDQWVGTAPVFNLILPEYLLSAVWLYLARRRAGDGPSAWPWFAAFLLVMTVGVALMVRQYFHGAILPGPAVPNTEAYGYSLAFLIVSIGLILAGVRLPDKALRIAGLILLTATIVKVFLVDASALTGVLRILSFLVLGIALIGIGRLYGPILRAEREEA